MSSLKLRCPFFSSPWLFFQLLPSFLQDWGSGCPRYMKEKVEDSQSRKDSSFDPGCSLPSLIHDLSLALLMHAGHSAVAHYPVAKPPYRFFPSHLSPVTSGFILPPKRKCCLLSCAADMGQHWEVDQGTDRALRNRTGKRVPHPPHSVATEVAAVVQLEQQSRTVHGKEQKIMLLILVVWERRFWE